VLGREGCVPGLLLNLLDCNDVAPALVDVLGQLPIRSVDDALFHLLYDLDIKHLELLGRH